jgi:D-lactate dehydrogenase (cytochrome)
MLGSRPLVAKTLRTVCQQQTIKGANTSIPKDVSRQQRAFRASFQHREQQKQSFKGQLYESTQQRLKRERAEQERFSRSKRDPPGLRYAAITLSSLAFLIPEETISTGS